MASGRPYLLFAAMCLIWGTTWIAMRAGVEAVPPILFAGTRFMAAGMLLLGFLAVRGGLQQLDRADLPRLAAASALMVAATYALLFWGCSTWPPVSRPSLSSRLCQWHCSRSALRLGKRRSAEPVLWQLGSGAPA